MNGFIVLAVLAAFSVSMAFSRRWSLKNRDIKGEMCQSGDGSSYRGYVSKSAYGNRCLRWGLLTHPWGNSEGITHNHNYCRNPDQSLMPWCYIQRKRRAVREFCNVPKCDTPKISPADTELTCGERFERRMHKIVGGSFTTIESQPWVAALFLKKRRFLCGGSLIAPCWVLTAAHCFPDGNRIDISLLSVYLGKSAINETDADREQSFTVEKLIIHENYNDSNLNNDIALLKIKSHNGGCAVKSPSTRTVCLPPVHTQLPAGFQCSIAGFGKESYGAWRYSQRLKQTQVRLISQAECTELYPEHRITENMICAGSPSWSTDACEGDSGGPLVCEMSDRMFIFGVVSWGEDCAKKNKPGVYTQVTNYNDWMAEKTGLSKYTDGVMYPGK
ncbi:plasminogen activator, urokinase a [Toxotes jaculatrix]|uniref:plasminogen activator, urokinase a n=1 Tax=Toxotes jaculatrix TaxID=941984 RepID=UPI001B3A7E6D|nr:plasminogen activator, urokinase a [Toxotes jaculatrix]